MDYIRWLDELSKDDLAIAGGKGANLGELHRIGMPVPPAFVITTAANIDANSVEVKESILAAYHKLGAGAVAVRSSATAEDLPEAAFAGQQETYLNVVGDAALLDAVRNVWASLWGERAVAYRARLGIDDQQVRIAVVVQQMILAEAAGVLFTANTVTGARDEIIINANPGLGEAVVSGEVTPDHFVLQKKRARWRVVERQIGRSEVTIRARAGGGVERLEKSVARSDPVLPERSLQQLARLAAKIQQHFGTPQDIEWAWADGAPFILQARPITALPSPPPRANKVIQFVAANYGEIFAVRPYPLDLDTWIPALAGAIEPMFELMGLKFSLRKVFEIEDGVAIRIRARLPHPSWRTLLAPARVVSLVLRYDSRKWGSDARITQAQQLTRAWESRDLQTLSWKDLLGAFEVGKQITRMAAGDVRRRYFPDAGIATLQLRVLLAVLGRGHQFESLLARVETKTMEVNRRLEELAQTIRSDSGLKNIFSTHEPSGLWRALEQDEPGRRFLGELKRFLAQYGHREAVLGTALQPTWKDAPEVVLGMLKSFVAHDSPRQTRDEYVTPRLPRLLRKRVEKARALFQLREDTHFYATMSLPLFRRVSLELGRRLRERGVLDVDSDVFHLTLIELTNVDEQANELRTIVARRKRKRAELERTPLVDPRLFPRSAARADAVLTGTPGSPGIADGPVRVVRSNAEFGKLRAGDVLVAPYTNPAWTPLFQRVAAVVVDSGSVGSHAAIVAREYGIPAVMGTVDGTSKLEDDELVRVDGTQGYVFRT